MATYIKTADYKKVFVLAGFRRMLCLSGAEVVNSIRKIWSQKNKNPAQGITADFMTMVEQGVIILDKDEIRAYSDYIAENMKYDKDAFYYELCHYASNRIHYIDSQEHTNTSLGLIQAYAIVEINEILD